MFVKVLLFLLGIWLFFMLAIWLISAYLRRLLKNTFRPKPKSGPQTNPNAQKHSATLVECRACGVYIPQNQALQENNWYYCSQRCKKSHNAP